MGAGASRRTSQHRVKLKVSSHKQVFVRPSKSLSPSKSPVLWEKEAKDQCYKQGFFSHEGFYGFSQTSTSMPELLREHLRAANLGTYIPAVSRWMEKEGVLDFAELEATEIQDLYEELNLSTKCRRLFDICLGLYLEVLVKNEQSMYWTIAIVIISSIFNAWWWQVTAK